MTSAQDFKTEIDQWLGSKDERTIRKIWQVVSDLNTEWQLRDNDIFDIPYDKSERARITNSKDLEIVLEALHKRTVIEISKKTTSFLLDPNEPHSFWDVEVAKIEMFKTADTQVKIFPKQFAYLRDALAKMVSEHPQGTVKQKNNKQSWQDTEKQQEASIPVRIVSGKMEIEGLEKGLVAIAKTSKENRNKFPHKLPAGTKWEDSTIKFEDEENVFIQVKQFKYNASYREMGFVGKGNNPNPSEAWTFLKVLAKLNGELTLKDPEARDKYKKQKELLAKALQSYFSLDYDPFYPYHSSSEKGGNSYKIKITLIPPPNRDEREVISKDKDDLGVKEYLNEQNKQVYKEE